MAIRIKDSTIKLQSNSSDQYVQYISIGLQMSKMTPKTKTSFHYISGANKENETYRSVYHHSGVISLPIVRKMKSHSNHSDNVPKQTTTKNKRSGQKTGLQTISNTSIKKTVKIFSKLTNCTTCTARKKKLRKTPVKKLPRDLRQNVHRTVTRNRATLHVGSYKVVTPAPTVVPMVPVIHASEPSSSVVSVDTFDLNALLNSLPDIGGLLQAPATLIADIDAEQGDVLYMKDYAKDFYTYLQNIEHKCVCPAKYLQDVDLGMPTSSMRSVLLDWLMQVQSHLNLKDETLHLTAKLIDKLQLVYPVKLDRFQLIGISCLLLAAKYEERFAPEVNLLIHLTDNSYTRVEVLDMEQILWRTLNYDLCWPTAMTFLRRYLQVIAANKEFTCNFTHLKTLSLYLVDQALIYNSMTSFYPSETAAAALCLAMCVLKPTIPDVWDATMVHYSNYTERQLGVCMGRYAELVADATQSNYQAARKKHSRYDVESEELISKLSKTSIIQDLITNETSF